MKRRLPRIRYRNGTMYRMEEMDRPFDMADLFLLLYMIEQLDVMIQEEKVSLGMHLTVVKNEQEQDKGRRLTDE